MSDEKEEGGKPGLPATPGGSGIEEEGDFGRMLEDSLEARSFEEGETVEGRVVAILPDVAFLDIGGKSEASIDIEELKDAEGDLEVEVGDRIRAIVMAGDGGLRLSRRLAHGAAVRERLLDAYRTGLPVEGRVERAIKGGYEVRIAQNRAFCPISQIDSARTTDPAVHEGKTYLFRIVEHGEGGRNLVVSRRALLEEEGREKAQETRRAIVPGAVVAGKVASVREYGAFVELGPGVEGLLHVSEIGWSRVTSPAELLKIGDDVTVKVLRVEPGEKGKISLSLKELQPDPWSCAEERYEPGKSYPGRITRLADFGAFVELEPGVEALAHASTFPPSRTPDEWRSGVPPGTTGRFEVQSIDLGRRRIGVAMIESGPSSAETLGTTPTEGAASQGARIVPGARIKGKVDRHEKFGVFVYLAPGKTGLLPVSEIGASRGTDLRKTFPKGSEVEVIVLEVEPGGKRIRLSQKAVLAQEEKLDARAYTEEQDRAASRSFGSLKDKLQAALSKRKE